MDVPKALAEAAMQLALDIDANAILALTDTGKICDPLLERGLSGKNEKKIKLVLATPNNEIFKKFSRKNSIKLIKLTAKAQGRFGQAYHAMVCGLQEGIFCPGERLVCISGDGLADNADALLVLHISEREKMIETLESDSILAATVEIALELGKGGSNGKPIGTAFLIGDSKAVLRLSYQLMLNPFKSYSVNITDEKHHEIIKKYATFDGAFVVGEDGRVIAAERYLNADVKVEIPHGLGTRHLAVAAMTAATKAKGVTVSGEDGLVRIFKRGKLVAKIDPRSGILEHLREALDQSEVKNFMPKD